MPAIRTREEAARVSGLLRLELVVLVVFSAIWLLVILGGLEIVPLAGALNLDLYRLYSIAAVFGWVAGNIYVARAQNFEGAPLGRRFGGASLGRRVADAPAEYPFWRRLRKRLLLSYVMGPLSVVFLLRLLAPQAVQEAAPVVPIYSLGVYALFFLVPLTLRATRTPRRGFRDK